MQDTPYLDPGILVPLLALVAPLWAFMHFIGQVAHSSDRSHAANFALLSHVLAFAILFLLPQKQIPLFSPSLIALELISLLSLAKGLSTGAASRTLSIVLLSWAGLVIIYFYYPELLLPVPRY